VIPEGLSDGAGVLLVGHGTRDHVGTSQFSQLASRLADRLAPMPVERALLEFQEPTIPQGWDALVAQGVTHVHVAPLLLFAAGHAKQDIPNLIRQCQVKTPGISFDQTRPLSRHPAMIQLAERRLSETLCKSTSPVDRTAVVMVGRGSHDPCAQADMRVLSEVVARRLSLPQVATAFYAMANPRLPTVLNELAACGQFDTIAIQPHLLFEGRLFQAILHQIDEASERYPSIQWIHSDYLGPDPLIAEAIAGRIEAAGISSANAFTS
jgi:sirohydrochlorin cobaltochelatase